jgi:protein Mpv17
VWCCLVLIRVFLSAVFGPVATTWFGILQRHVVLKGTAATTAARVAADQLVFTPVQLTCFLSSMAIMEGVSPVDRLKSAFVPAYKANLMVWPFVQSINFTFVPLELRVLVVNIVSLGKYFALSSMSLKLLTTNRLELLPQFDEQRRGIISLV